MFLLILTTWCVISIRWAFDDPNPVAQQALERSDKDALVEMMKGRGVSLSEQNMAYPSNYHPQVWNHSSCL